MSPALGMFQGFMAGDHTVPLNGVVCGKNICVSGRQKYCRKCGINCLLPLSHEDYLTLAPDHTNLERDLPHYDDSMGGR